MKRIANILVLLHLLAGAVLVAGCGSSATPDAPEQQAAPVPQGKAKEEKLITSPVPVPANSKAYGQITAQAADHWRAMAAYTAARVYKAFDDRPDLLERPIFVATPNNRPFTVAYYHLLRTELVSRGLQVSYEKEPRSVLLEFAVQAIPFDSARFANAEKFEGQGEGSDHEIIVSSRLFYRNRFVMHCSSVRYINDEDLALYVDPQVADPMAESTRNIRITGK